MTRRSYASPPCLAHEVDPAYFDPGATDPQQAADVARWRRAERTRLIAARDALGAEARGRIAAALAGHLDALLAARFGDLRSRVVSVYWPIRAEFNLRHWFTALHEAGVLVALPVVAARGAPLIFRRWTPEAQMVQGHWKIPVPNEAAQVLTPDITLAPLVGWDGGGYRLGYGGGYFDRTLAAAAPRPFAIGVGMQAARLHSIYPQPHDIAMDVIITEAGVQVSKESV
jgi:5,10-methenyltetrahydrofolate synthetase